jgi:ribose transport system ATP-binding protein
MTDVSAPPFLEARRIGKRFPGVVALDGVDLVARPGEVLAVIGENGAGKSTLMKILGGVQQPDAGQVLVDGAPVTIGSVRQAERLGIGLIHQELNLADNLDVASNLFLGREPNRFGIVNRRRLYRDAAALLERAGFDLDPRQPVRSMPIGQQQLVEIAKALSLDARVLIMDEPSSSLSARESERLFDVIRDLRARGVAILYISHRLAEVEALADRVLGLRDGRNAGELSRGQISRAAMVRLMVGRDLSQQFPHTAHRAGEVVLRARGLRTRRFPQHAIDLELRAGEVVAVAGLVGSGRSELLHGLFGVDPPISGEIEALGRPLAPGRPLESIRAGVALVPEDRKQQGLVIEMNVRENLSLASLAQHHTAGLRSGAYERRVSGDMIGRLGIRTPGDRQVVRYLSGGNQQKVVFGKWLATRPKVLLLDEPTRGIDVGAKREIYTIMSRLAAEGTAILFVSSELEEVLGMSDRALVMHDGALAGELSRAQLSEEAIMRLATGQAEVFA